MPARVSRYDTRYKILEQDGSGNLEFADGKKVSELDAGHVLGTE